MSFNPPADSAFHSRSYACFITDQELQQAKADVDECYRRRARRAGLEETLPVSRHMTDEEIDDLKWQLGDFGPANGYWSRGTKRGKEKEVIDMTIEEMEAEMQETTELIRKSASFFLPFLSSYSLQAQDSVSVYICPVCITMPFSPVSFLPNLDSA
jgi:hypothetical protein